MTMMGRPDGMPQRRGRTAGNDFSELHLACPTLLLEMNALPWVFKSCFSSCGAMGSPQIRTTYPSRQACVPACMPACAHACVSVCMREHPPTQPQPTPPNPAQPNPVRPDQRRRSPTQPSVKCFRLGCPASRTRPRAPQGTAGPVALACRRAALGGTARSAKSTHPGPSSPRR